MNEQGYLELMRKILEKGEERCGRNGATKCLFGERLEFDLKAGFPLLTTKRVFWRGMVEELLWFLRGSTDVTELQAKGVHIWDGNSSRGYLDSVGLLHVPENSIGKAYGWQWRNASGSRPYVSLKNALTRCKGCEECPGCDLIQRKCTLRDPNDGFDQIRYIINELRSNPHGRRAVLNAWNPAQLSEMALQPCHVMYNFFVGERGLSCQMVMRSCDVGAGLPFNIASVALLTTIIGHVLGVETDRVIIVTGDTHIYAEHVESAITQIERIPMSLPTVRIVKQPPDTNSSVWSILEWIEDLTFADFELTNYTHHPPLKYSMVV